MEKENKVSLYELAGSIKQIENMEDEGLTEYLDTLNLQFSDKAENIIRYRQSLTMSADAISNERERLQKLENGLRSRAKSLEGYLSMTMIKNSLSSISTSIAKISFRKSETTEITNPEIIPAEYKITKTVESIDKNKIKTDIKNGLDIPGAILKEHQNIQIR